MDNANADLAECTAETKECHTKSEKSMVYIAITDKTKWASVEFSVGGVAKATLTIAELEAGKPASPVTEPPKGTKGTDNKLEISSVVVPCIPEAVTLIKKALNVNDTPLNKNPACSSTKDNCYTITNEYYPVYVKAEMKEAARILTMKDYTNILKATFKPLTGNSNSAVSWMSHSFALMLTNAAMMLLLH
ncbi:unnamed protein product [Dibothriocephalus latus]|uniref:Uncharacterized protein n=1 Tax=Dibothriocephalus latus TaxID=60516 RepID=A0A3P6RGG8_DIBLA|nr:unnamed protein product [Dibothriocephalus latus]